MNKPKFWNDYKLVDNGNLTKNIYTLHYFHNQLISEYDNGNVEVILRENKQLKEKVNQLETNIDEVIKEIKKRSTPEVAQLYIEILERGKE